MEKRRLGNTGIHVTRLCYGALPIGPLQADAGVREGAGVISHALERGVNFIDTAQVYGTYPYIREALKGFGGDVVLGSKTVAADYEGMRAAIEEAIAETGASRVDVMYLHAARVTESVLTERREALRCLADAKREGLVGAAGISTHSVAIVKAAAAVPEIDVMMPIINMEGLGIIDGTAADMASAIRLAASEGKGVVAQKALGGGHLIDRFQEAIGYVLDLPVASIAIGMVSRDEVDANVAVFEGNPVDAAILSRIGRKTKTLRVQRFCKGCGTCVKTCPSQAIGILEGKAVVDHSRCVLCGYCCPVCPEFALRLA